ncbi:putative membrane protein [Mariprofundus ferrinatatus]|uniref:Putative membrane protein n=1 Tax=Mariprofundus ferrinatatus TaxID=1921087 RepID=A0A2K8L170_9PROT|nr:DUF1614 domain-containing protein [Mariprofundus ferrinatatus]ATX81065.1 putative membrane protein [Mariprofundus ferrinatatus]
MPLPPSPGRLLLLIVLSILAGTLLLSLVQLGVISLMVEKLGISPMQGILFLIFSLIGSALNLPLVSIKAIMPDNGINVEVAQKVLGIPVPKFQGKTMIAINVGGCMIPIVFSASLIYRFPIGTPELLLSVGICSIICYLSSRPIPGVGIGMMPLVAPVTAAIIAVSFGGEYAAPLAYITGTLGVLVGADLMHIRDIARLGTPVASIGGAGTFDGIFLTGIVAVLLT